MLWANDDYLLNEFLIKAALSIDGNILKDFRDAILTYGIINSVPWRK
jgi:hypothetical protein